MIRKLARNAAFGLALLAAAFLLLFVLMAVAGLLHMGFEHFVNLLLR